jgi:hypothetical protein
MKSGPYAHRYAALGNPCGACTFDKQTRFTIAGRKVGCSTDTTDRAAAEEFEEQLRRRYWRQIKLGEKHYTCDQAAGRSSARPPRTRTCAAGGDPSELSSGSIVC